MQETDMLVNPATNPDSLNDLAKSGMDAQLITIIQGAPIIKTEKAAAKEYLKQFDGLAIVDAEGYRAAVQYAKEIRATRLEMDKRFSGATMAMKTLVKAYDKDAGELVLLYKTVEANIRTEIKRVDDEKQQERERIEREAAQRFMERTDRLFESGYTFNGYLYTCGTIFLDSDKISDLPDEDFAAMVEKGRIESERIAAILAASETQGEVDLVVIQGEPEPPGEALPVADDTEKEAAGIDWFGTPVAGENETQRFVELPDRSTTTLTFFPKIQPVPDPNFRPPGFTAGYDACKKAVLEILSREQKFTRVELVFEITGLRP